jgi:hypothetical protein
MGIALEALAVVVPQQVWAVTAVLVLSVQVVVVVALVPQADEVGTVEVGGWK